MRRLGHGGRTGSSCRGRPPGGRRRTFREVERWDGVRWSRSWIDGLVVFAVTTVGLFGLAGPRALTGAEMPAAWPLGVALVVGQAGVLWWRRRAPTVVLAATIVVLLAAQALGQANAASFFGPHAAAYTAGLHAGALAAPALLLVGAVADLAIVTWAWPAAASGSVLASPTGVLAVAAWAIGRYVRMRRAYVEAMVDHARRLESDRDRDVAQAVAEERRRIARDLHDQVAHELGVVSLQTAAARRWLGRDPSAAETALIAAEGAARGALETMPTILRALRTDGEPTAAHAPQPSLADLGQLVADATAAGLAVEVVTEGRPRPLPGAVDLTASLAIREALTNVTKHAGANRARVRLLYAPTHLEVEVMDDGRGPSTGSGGPADRLPSGGHGLLGMRERAELLGGRVVADRLPGGGFIVRMTLPLTREVPA